MIRVRDRVADRLVSRQALSPAAAVAYQPQGRFERWLFGRLLQRRAVVEVAPGRYYLDAALYTAQNVAWERRATRVSFFGAITLSVLAMLFYRGGA
ncbi:MAG: hypothetical protein JWL96_2059 [Sphingomonas bacterium]|nr:hypothetical protein [Sphingomonas bacterium]